MGQQARWTLSDVQIEKNKIREQIAAIEEPREKLNFIHEKISEFQGSQVSEEQLQLIVFCISSLVHHERFGGLTGAQITSITSLCINLLQFNGIKPFKSKLSSIYTDLFLARGLVKWQEGDRWGAMWEQLAGISMTKDVDDEAKAFQNLTAGVRYLRHGFGDLAINALKIAQKGLNGRHKLICEINLLKALRLSGDNEKFFAHLNYCKSVDGDNSFALEVAWEEICQEANLSKKLVKMAKSVSRGGDFAEHPTYLLEAMLWAWAYQDDKAIKKMPKISYLDRGRSFKPKEYGFFYESCRVLARCNDEAVDPVAKVVQLGNLLAKRSKLDTVDKELLLLASAQSWLRKNKLPELTNVTAASYSQLCFSLTSQRTGDLLKIFS